MDAFTLLFTAGAVPLITVFMILYCSYAKHCKSSLLAKCGGSFVSLFTAAVFSAAAGNNPFSSLLFWGLLLCVAADALLDINFIWGMATFGLAHMLFIIRLFSMGSFSWATAVLWAVIYAIAVLFFHKDFTTVKKLRFVFYLYPLVLAGMAALALSLPFAAGIHLWPTALGGLLFAFSDFLVGKSFFGKKCKYSSGIIMGTYYAALYLLALNAGIC